MCPCKHTHTQIRPSHFWLAIQYSPSKEPNHIVLHQQLTIVGWMSLPIVNTAYRVIAIQFPLIPSHLFEYLRIFKLVRPVTQLNEYANARPCMHVPVPCIRACVVFLWECAQAWMCADLVRSICWRLEVSFDEFTSLCLRSSRSSSQAASLLLGTNKLSIEFRSTSPAPPIDILDSITSDTSERRTT